MSQEIARQQSERGKIQLNSANLHYVYHGRIETRGEQLEGWAGKREDGGYVAGSAEGYRLSTTLGQF